MRQLKLQLLMHPRLSPPPYHHENNTHAHLWDGVLLVKLHQPRVHVCVCLHEVHHQRLGSTVFGVFGVERVVWVGRVRLRPFPKQAGMHSATTAACAGKATLPDSWCVVMLATDKSCCCKTCSRMWVVSPRPLPPPLGAETAVVGGCGAFALTALSAGLSACLCCHHAEGSHRGCAGGPVDVHQTQHQHNNIRQPHHQTHHTVFDLCRGMRGRGLLAALVPDRQAPRSACGRLSQLYRPLHRQHSQVSPSSCVRSQTACPS